MRIGSHTTPPFPSASQGTIFSAGQAPPPPLPAVPVVVTPVPAVPPVAPVPPLAVVVVGLPPPPVGLVVVELPPEPEVLESSPLSIPKIALQPARAKPASDRQSKGIVKRMAWPG